MPIPTPQAGAQAWTSGVSGAQTKYVNAIEATTDDVAGLAVQAQGRMVANWTNVVSSGEWARRVLARGTPYWKQQSVKKAGNYGASATTGQANYLNAAQQLYPYEQNLQAQVKQAKAQGAMPLDRFRLWMEGMIAFKGQYTP